MQVSSQPFKHMGLAATCPEGSRIVGNDCVCYPGRVWMPDGSKCVSPQAPAYSGAIGFKESYAGHTPDTYGQQELTAAARNYIESAGHSITCKIDDNWVASPAGGTPSRICSIDGGPFIHGAYTINLNPYNALVDIGSNVNRIVSRYGGAFVQGSPTGQQESVESGSDDDIEDVFSGEDVIAGIPNWLIVGGVGVGAYFLISK